MRRKVARSCSWKAGSKASSPGIVQRSLRGGAAFEAGPFGGALVPPGVIKSGHLVAEFRADGAGVTADEFLNGGFADAEGAGDAGGAVAHDVQGAQPEAGAARVHAGRCAERRVGEE